MTVESIDEVRRRQRPAGAGSGSGRVPPHNLQAEESLLGAMLLSRDAIAAAVDTGLTPDDFYKPTYGHIFEAVQRVCERGDPADPVTVADQLQRDGLLDAIGGPSTLVSLQAGTPATSNALRYARIVGEHAVLRRLIGAANDIVELGYAAPDDVDAAIACAVARLDKVVGQRLPRRSDSPPTDLLEFLNEDEPEHDWIVEGLLERGDRVILTGREGGGKSTLLRQTAVKLAAGVHPFTDDPIQPVHLGLVDLENSRAHLRRELRRIWLPVRNQLAAETLTVVCRPQGLDLLAPDDVAYLERVLLERQVELLMVGPLYKLASGDPTSEEVARAVAAALDRLRATCGVAVLLEAHSPHATNGGRRPTRPYGASLWLRWPEFGMHLGEDGALTHWRGARDERAWPAALKRGGEWPWTAATNSRELTFARILDETRAAGQRLSVRDLATRIGADRNAVQRAIDANRKQYDQVVEELEG